MSWNKKDGLSGMTNEALMKLKFQDREFFQLYRHRDLAPIASIGVALTNEEAQRYIDCGLKVAGDNEGPYLVARVGRDIRLGSRIPRGTRADLSINAIRTAVHDRTHYICWLVRIA